MAEVSLHISVDPEVKAKAQELFADFGMDLSTAINVFLRQSIRENAIPFNIYREIPNEETAAAIREVAEMKKQPEQYKKYASFAEVVAEVMTDA